MFSLQLSDTSSVSRLWSQYNSWLLNTTRIHLMTCLLFDLCLKGFCLLNCFMHQTKCIVPLSQTVISCALIEVTHSNSVDGSVSTVPHCYSTNIPALDSPVLCFCYFVKRHQVRVADCSCFVIFCFMKLFTHVSSGLTGLC